MTDEILKLARKFEVTGYKNDVVSFYHAARADLEADNQRLHEELDAAIHAAIDAALAPPTKEITQ